MACPGLRCHFCRMTSTSSCSRTVVQRMSNEYWNRRRGVIFSTVGGWSMKGEVRCRERDLLNDLLRNHSYFQVLIYSVSGKLVDARLARWIEASLVCLSYPDHRIWCNQIGTLAGEL